MKSDHLTLMTSIYICWHLMKSDHLTLITSIYICWHLMTSDDIWWQNSQKSLSYLMTCDDSFSVTPPVMTMAVTCHHCYHTLQEYRKSTSWHLMTSDDIWWQLTVSLGQCPPCNDDGGDRRLLSPGNTQGSPTAYPIRCNAKQIQIEIHIEIQITMQTQIQIQM